MTDLDLVSQHALCFSLYMVQVPSSAHNILIPSACAAVPYIIRARQCLVMHTVGRLQVRISDYCGG